MLPNYQGRSPFVLKHTTSLCMAKIMSCSLRTDKHMYAALKLLKKQFPSISWITANKKKQFPTISGLPEQWVLSYI